MYFSFSRTGAVPAPEGVLVFGGGCTIKNRQVGLGHSILNAEVHVLLIYLSALLQLAYPYLKEAVAMGGGSFPGFEDVETFTFVILVIL